MNYADIFVSEHFLVRSRVHKCSFHFFAPIEVTVFLVWSPITLIFKKAMVADDFLFAFS